MPLTPPHGGCFDMMTESTRPTVTGNFQKTPFAHILVYLFQRQISGTLLIRNTSADEVLWFEKGAPSAASFTFAPADMRSGILELFNKPLSYAFHENAYLIRGAAQFAGKLSPLALIHASLRKGKREDVISTVLNRLQGKMLSVRRDLSKEEFEFDQAEQALVTALQMAPFTLDQALARGLLPTEDARRLLYLLAIAKALVAVTEAPASTHSEPVKEARRPSQVVMPPKRRPASLTMPMAQPTFRAQSKRPPARVALATPEAPPRLTPELTTRWQEITGLYQRLDEMTYYDILEISPRASADDASKAYMKLAKRWHPDRLPSMFGDLLEHMREIFRYLTEAHETLSSDNKRLEYEQLVKSGLGSPASQKRMLETLDSATEVQRADVLLQQRLYNEALVHAETAINLTPKDADAHVAYASALYNLHADSKEVPFDDMLKSLNIALDDNSKHERAHYYKGLILKRMGKTKEALAHFKLTLQINPRNVDAAREIRLATLRKESIQPGRPGSGGSLFGKLFKK